MKRVLTIIMIIFFIIITASATQSTRKMYKATGFLASENCILQGEYKKCVIMMEHDIGNRQFKIYLDTTITIKNLHYTGVIRKNRMTFHEYVGIDNFDRQVSIVYIKMLDRIGIEISFDECNNYLFELEQNTAR